MILLKNFYPIVKTNINTFAQLENEYKNRIKDIGNINPEARLVEWLNAGNLYGVHLTNQTRPVIQKVLSDYRKGVLLTARPKKMAAIIKRYDKAGYNGLMYSGSKSTEFGSALLSVFGYEGRFRSVQSKGLWLANMLNIKVCPYCNSQYTMVVKKSDGSSFGKFQFDHFFSKDRYPYLSIALYNLIPSCASCNHKKANSTLRLQTHFNPHYNDLSNLAEFHVVYPADPVKMTLKNAMALTSDDINITFVSKFKDKKKYVKSHSELYDIEFMYKRHTDIAHELLVKAILYNKHYQKATLALSNIFPDRQTLLRYILGNYLNNEQINLRPLSKFTIDIARQLGLIK